MGVLGAFVVPHPPLLVPAIGRGEEKKVEQTVAAYREVMRRVAALRPDTVVVTSPHTTMYADYFQVSPGAAATGDFAAFGAPEVRFAVAYDEEFTQALSEECRAAGVDGGTAAPREPQLDHGTMVPLWFLEEALRDFRLVRIGLSGLSPLQHYRLGECLARTAERLNRRLVHLASGDFSHKLRADGPYGFAAAGADFDAQCMAALAAGDFLALLSLPAELAEEAAECGLRSFWIMAGALDGREVAAEQLSYEGPFGVGYGVVSFLPGAPSASRRFGEAFAAAEKERREAVRAAEDDHVKLARRSLESFVRTGRRAPLPADVLPALKAQRAGVFVSLHKDGRLRGCIGTFQPTTDNVAAEIWQNAVSAAAEDPRFPAVTAAELEDLVYSVDVLTAPEPAASEADLDAARYGVIVAASGGRRGLLLPDLPGVQTVAEQVAIARQKGGIDKDEPVDLYRFEVVRHR